MSGKAVWIGLAVISGLGAAGSPGQTSAKPARLFGLGEVRVLAVSPDTRFLASGGQAGAFVWDIGSAELLHRLDTPHTVTALAFTKSNQVLLTASATTIAAWNPETGVQVQEFVGHEREINSLKIGPGGKTFVSASADNTCRVWSFETGQEVSHIRIPGSPITDIAISADGGKLATIDTFLTNCVKIWDLSSSTQLGSIPKTNWTASRCLFTPDGHLVVAAPDRTVTLWDTERAEVIRSFEGITNRVTAVIDLWMPNQEVLAVACSDGTVHLWNLDSGVHQLVVPGEPVLAAAGVPDDFLIAAAQIDYNVRIRQLPGGDTLRTFIGHTTSSHSAVAFSPDGRYVLSGGTEMATRLWDRQTGRLLRTFSGSPAGTAAAAFSPDGTRVITTVGLPNPGVRLWRSETAEVEREFQWQASWPASAAISADGLRVAAGAQDGSTRVFDVASGQLIKTFQVGGWVSEVAFSPVAPVIASGAGGDEPAVIIHNIETGAQLFASSANAGPIVALDFSDDGRLLLAAWQDGLVRVYAAPSFELQREFGVPAAFLEAAAFSPDARFILTGESFPFLTATLWNTETAEAVRVFPIHKWTASAVAFDQSGTSILTGADMVREWTIADLTAGLTIERANGEARVRWSLGQLHAAPAVDGPWQAVPGATSPWTIPVESPSVFYRVRVD